jgi:hypothetical protein
MSSNSQNISSPSSCIYCREKTPNKGHPYCTNCFKLRTATQRPCFTCKSVSIACKPAFQVTGPMKRLYCTDCTKQYYYSKRAKDVTPVEHIEHVQRVEHIEHIEPIVHVLPTVHVTSDTPDVQEDDWINIAYKSTVEKDGTLLEQMKELDKETILEKVRELLKQKEHIIRLLRYENIYFNYIQDNMDQEEMDEDYDPYETVYDELHAVYSNSHHDETPGATPGETANETANEMANVD